MPLVADTTAITMSDALSGIFDLVPNCISVITSNTVMMTFFCAGVIGVAIGVIRKLKHA